MTEENRPLPKLPRATLRGDKLYVEGAKKPYFRDPKHTIVLRVDAITIHQGPEKDGIGNFEGGWAPAESLSGIAKLEGHDRFAVIGYRTDPNTAIAFQLKPLLPKLPVPAFLPKQNLWHAQISLFTHRDYFNQVQEEKFYVHAYCPKNYFDDLLAVLRKGHTDHIRVGMQTEMFNSPLLAAEVFHALGHVVEADVDQRCPDSYCGCPRWTYRLRFDQQRPDADHGA